MLLRGLLLHGGRVFAAARGTGALRAVEKSFLGGGNVGVFAVPDVHGGRLDGTGKGVGERPGQMAAEAGVHGAETGAGLLAGLSAGEEGDAGNGCWDSAKECVHGCAGDFFIAVLMRGIFAGDDHVGFEDHAFEEDALGNELVEDRVEGGFSDSGAALEGMVAVHQDFGFDDGDEAGLLAEGGIESEEQGVGFDATEGRDSVADGDDGAPLGKTGTHVCVFGEAFAEGVEAGSEFLAGVGGHGFGAGVDFDSGNDALLFEGFGEGGATSSLLADGFIHEDGAVKAVAQAAGGDDHVAIGAAGFFILRDTGGGKAPVGGGGALVHSEQTFVAGHHRPGCFGEFVYVHERAPFCGNGSCGSKRGESVQRRLGFRACHKESDAVGVARGCINFDWPRQGEFAENVSLGRIYDVKTIRSVFQMRVIASLTLLVCAAAPGQQLTPVPPPATGLPSHPFFINRTWVIGGVGDWDYLTMDPTARELFIAHGPSVQVVDVDTGTVAGTIDGMREAHQVVLDGDNGFGYVSDGQADMVRVFDRHSFQVVANIPTGPLPRSMALDAASGLLFVIGAAPMVAGTGAQQRLRTMAEQGLGANARGTGTPSGTKSTITVIDIQQRIPLAEIVLSGSLGFAKGDGEGRVYVTVQDRNQILRLNATAVGSIVEQLIRERETAEKKREMAQPAGPGSQVSGGQTSGSQADAAPARRGQPRRKDEPLRLDLSARIPEELRDIYPHTLWLDSSCQDPRAMAIDRAHERLFVACNNFRMVVLNPGTDQTIAALPIGLGPDAVVYDANRGLIFTANGGGDGSLTIIRQDVTDTYAVIQTLPTRQAARTLALDPSTGELYLTSVLYGAEMSTPFTNGSPAPLKVMPVDSSFQVIVVGN
jgi:DNA-binding beta-propeller fold protein YncE